MEKFSIFRLFAKDNVLQPYITQKDFVTFNDYPADNLGYKSYVFDIRHYQDFSSLQPIKNLSNSTLADAVAAKMIGCALLLI